MWETLHEKKRRYGPGVRRTGFRYRTSRARPKRKGRRRGSRQDRGSRTNCQAEGPEVSGRFNAVDVVKESPGGRAALGPQCPYGSRLSVLFLVTPSVSQPATHIAKPLSLNHSLRPLDTNEPRAAILRPPPRRRIPCPIGYHKYEASLPRLPRPNVLVSRARMPLFSYSDDQAGGLREGPGMAMHLAPPERGSGSPAPGVRPRRRRASRSRFLRLPRSPPTGGR